MNIKEMMIGVIMSVVGFSVIMILPFSFWFKGDTKPPTPRTTQVIMVTDSVTTSKIDSTYALLKRMDKFIRE